MMARFWSDRFAPEQIYGWGKLTNRLFVLTTQVTILFWGVMAIWSLASVLLSRKPSRGNELQKKFKNVPGKV
jgi:hypothetical protein